ncbi:small-conductance mechanosensitive channel [Rubricella aquisinus]|uniref:Small-conductance mechanosensitive channel n=1 Tax=Rubricella aquisinus TaxID=2028108 RepID=A0A840WSB3_9RHOB|nr:mechanosensitive ion channel domain-containing protein [Rubricella aquisinus]MBB5516913.1 small-conductance mechanosensitive channel [Rubricella aquisinus]
MNPEVYGVKSDLTAWIVNEKVAITVGFVLLVLLVRWVSLRVIRGKGGYLSDAQRQRMSIARSSTTIAIALGLIGYWLPEIENFAFSIAAFAVAIVIATKELILCLGGGLVRGLSGAFATGDWIEIGPHTGEVVDRDAFTTKLQEFDRVEFQYTGRLITLPNSLFLTTPVVNHTFRKRYIYHEFTIHSEPVPRALEAQEVIQSAMDVAWADLKDVAERYAAMIGQRSGIVLPDPAPEVHLRTAEFGKFRYTVKVFCPREKAAEMEQIAIAAWIGWVEAQPWQFAGTNPVTPE